MTIRRFNPTLQTKALDLAVERAGGLLSLCRKLGVTHQSVSDWRKRGCVPIPRAVAIEQLFGVPRMSLIDPALAAALAVPIHSTSEHTT